MGYLHNLLVEARRLAQTDEREFLVYLIEMAIIECGAGEPDRERERTTTTAGCTSGQVATDPQGGGRCGC